ncbi:hypothetical protein [Chloroflexus sp.]|uniref:hypothetical protein n=1 Tax=Chloroflexus sp. TaxID=1904827 RepID=UPI002ACEB3C4|nr:hypothetical protein [Chloroflexus sp.]
MRSAPNAPCGFRWTTQQLPDDAQAVPEALAATGIAVCEVTASGFDEECVTSRGVVKGFGVLAKTVNLTVEAADLADQAALGDYWAGSVTRLTTYHSSPKTQRCK